jgi:hypothetical protein
MGRSEPVSGTSAEANWLEKQRADPLIKMIRRVTLSVSYYSTHRYYLQVITFRDCKA